MKANELMIGDWVTHRGNPIQISSIGIACATGGDDDNFKMMHFLDLSPIPLTPAILEKNGFSFCTRDGGFYLYTTLSYGAWDVAVIVFNATDKYVSNQIHIESTPDDSTTFLHLMECNCVHQLQHALRLCGIDKNIEL